MEDRNLREEIDTLLGQINSHELRLSHGYAKLGGLLREAELSDNWKEWGFERFSLYLAYVGEKINRQKSQVYAILGAATTLLPYISETELETIGITKAHELCRYIKQSGLRPDVKITDPEDASQQITLTEYAARDKVTAAKLRLQVNLRLHQKEDPKGYWFDHGGCYYTPEEKKEWERAEELAAQIIGIPPDTSPHERKRMASLAMARECIGSWEVEVDEVFG